MSPAFCSGSICRWLCIASLFLFAGRATETVSRNATVSGTSHGTELRTAGPLNHAANSAPLIADIDAEDDLQRVILPARSLSVIPQAAAPTARAVLGRRDHDSTHLELLLTCGRLVI